MQGLQDGEQNLKNKIGILLFQILKYRKIPPQKMVTKQPFLELFVFKCY